MQKLLTLVIFSFLASCADPNLINPLTARDPKDLYLLAQQSFERSRYDLALQSLEKLDTNYPFSPFSNNVKLSLAYARYKSNKTQEAITSLDQYLTEKPYSPQAPYAWYLRGICYQQWSFGYFTEQLSEITRSDYDLISLKRAYANFEKVVTEYPDSIYSLDAAFRMKIIKDHLASSEITAGKYYYRRGAYIATINRAYYNLTIYHGSDSNQGALELLVEGYLGLSRKREASDALRILILNFPDNAKIEGLQNQVNALSE